VNGVFSRHQTWKECEALVKGRPAKYKKVTNEEEEAQVKKSWGV
jgi:viroplasmin and RNaseH domain-containing protein